MIRLALGALVCALGLGSGSLDTRTTAGGTYALAVSGAELAGPPWISIEYPVNPYDQTTKNAFLLVHAFHHGMPTDYPVTGTAEGLVKGERKTVTLEFERTSRPGVFALRKQWASDGVWSLVIAVNRGPDDAVYAVVDLAAAEYRGIRSEVPARAERGYTLPARLAMSEDVRSKDCALARAQVMTSGGSERLMSDRGVPLH
ncbi:MAG: hypothetical protein U0163_03440 [Gemmatimonadaceae bacterium]